MKNMALTKADKKADKSEGRCYLASDSKYPYGLCITLRNESLAKLGIRELPEVDEEFILTAKVVVTSVTSNDRQGKPAEKTMELQITAMELDDAGDGAVAAMNRGLREAKS